MDSIRRPALIAASLLILTACGGAPPSARPDTAADEAALRAGTEAWSKAYNAGDVESILALYAEDAVLMPPDAPAAAGREAMRAFIEKDIAGAKAAGVSLVIGEGNEGVSGDLAWHAGGFKVTNAAGATLGTGKYNEIWRRTGGKWLMIRDIWNNDAPPAAPPAGAPAEPAA